MRRTVGKSNGVGIHDEEGSSSHFSMVQYHLTEILSLFLSCFVCRSFSLSCAMIPPPWFGRLHSLNSSNTADKAARSPTPSPSPPLVPGYRRLSLQDVDDIDNWLSRLHRLEGALPSKAGLPSPLAIPAAASSSPSSRRASIAIESTSINSTWSSSSSAKRSARSGNNSPSTLTSPRRPQHHRRRSLAIFGPAEHDHLQKQVLPSPRPGTTRSTSKTDTTDAAYRNSSQLESHRRPSVLARAQSLLSITSQVNTDATLVNSSNGSGDLPRSHQSDKTYYEVADGSYVVLTEDLGGSAGVSDQENLESGGLDTTKVGDSGLPSLPVHEQLDSSADESRTLSGETTSLGTGVGFETQDCGVSVSSPIVDTARRSPYYAGSTPSITEEEVLSDSGLLPHQDLRDMSSPSDSFNPDLLLSSSRSAKSMSTTSSHPSSGKLQPRSPFASPKATFSLRKKKFPLDGAAASDIEDEADETDGVTALRSAFDAETEAMPQLQASNAVDDAIRTSKPVKKLSKSSFASSIDSVRGSLIASHDRRESSDSKASSSQSHTLPHMTFFARNSSKHPQVPLETSSPTWPAMQASSSAQQYPKLVARDERFYSSRNTRPRFSSTKSASSLKLGGELADAGNSSASDDEESLLNPRRASISSISPAYQRSKDEQRARLASSNHRISLAIPPLLTRSYSYDARVNASSTVAFDPTELARHIPDMKQTVLLWIVDDPGSGLPTSASVSRLSQHHSHSTSAAKGLANTILSTVPIHGRKKIVNRESAQVLLGEVRAGEDDSRCHYDTLDRKTREKQKQSSKGKEKISILLPAGHWKKCQAILKANGQLIISHDDMCMATVDLTTIPRTDVRPVDPSLLGRQRCLSLNIRNGSQIFLPHSPGFDVRKSPGFPLSPSAPDFSAFSSIGTSSPASSGRFSGLDLQDPLLLGSGSQTLFLAFPTTASQQAWIASFLCHAQPEVYPVATACKASTTLQEERSQSEGDDLEASTSSETRPKLTQHSSFRHAHHASEKIDHPIRMYRSVSLQIIQARCAREHVNPSLAQSLSALALYTLPQSPATPDMVQLPKRSGSLASEYVHVPQRKGSVASTSTSTLASGDASSGSASIQGDGQSTSSEQHSNSLPPQLRMSSLAHPPPTPPANIKKTESGKEKAKENEHHAEMFVEVRHNGEVLGRTGIRNVGSKTIWEEVFHFSNLGPYMHALELLVYVIGKHQIQAVGKVEVPLPTIRRNVATEDWYEVQPSEHASKKGHFEMPGELNLRVLVKEDISLPFQLYSKLGSLLAEDSDSMVVLSLLDSLQIELDLFAQLLLRIDTAHRRVLHRIISLCKKEVQRNDNLATLFRGNTLLTKTIEMHMRLVGSDFLDNTVGNVLRKLCEERVAIEIDPSRLDSKDSLTENIETLERWCEIIWSSIYNSRHSCPIELRRVLRKIRQIVDEHCEVEQAAGRLTEAGRARTRCTSVSAFISLRFFCPAILRPNLFRLCPSHPPDAKTSRTLTLITKVLMGMANIQTFGTKEPWMAAMNPFLQNNASSYQDFITYLCSKEEGTKSDWTEKEFELYKIPILKRMTLVPDIVKEGVPELPFLIDLPKEYAALASLVATAEPLSASAAGPMGSHTAESSSLHEDFVDTCRGLHSHARTRVRDLARSGELIAPSREHSRRLTARTEQVRMPMRMRGSTVSKAMSTPSPDRTALLSQSSSNGSIEEARAALFASSPASAKSGSVDISNLSTSTSPSMESSTSSESQMSAPSPLRSKRRSYTIAASPSMPRSESSPGYLSSSFSRPLPAPPPVDEEENTHDILNVKNPSTSPSRSVKDTNPRRLTIVAPRPPTIDQSIENHSAHHVLSTSGTKTPRAPTFTREQSDSLRELQETLADTAFDNSVTSIGSMPDRREEVPLSPLPPPSTKRRLFRKSNK
ncbi:hypothetical protein P389DRAFT_68010 [Cystobasidium minutum MCA 4210]|uniref:uncharacterized protein n=1 Tax=Cystobasidium minutum MCA 4210 TaxID=1397322 RepID=UPI0034D006BA|eukprot:jgi/Rhomi1/68010/CE68009_671